MCTQCEALAEKSAPREDTPIFWSLVNDMRTAGHSLPWYRTIKPTGTISMFSDMSTGIHPYQAYIRAGMMVNNPRDFLGIVDPT